MARVTDESRESVVATQAPRDNANSKTREEVPAPIVRLSLNVTQESDRILRTTAQKKGISVTEATRRAIAIMARIDEELEQGNRIESIDSDGRVARFVFI